MPIFANQTKRAPAFFVGHGNPMNAIADNTFTKSLRTLGESLQKPKAILMISAHWNTPYPAISLHKSDQLIYDMYGFPDALYKVEYPAPNADFLVSDLQKLIPNLHVEERNLDHGVWSVLIHLFPYADIPVMQLSIDSRLSMKEHFEMGRTIRRLREQGVMIIGSGNVTHNLGDISMQKNSPVVSWAKEFDDFIKNSILKQDYNALINFQDIQRYAQNAHPTIEHYIPLLYIAGSSYNDDKSEFIYESFEHGSLSMRSWLLK
ncbi:4,5-DOPA dioxygenase extradiol [Sulfurovum sp. zt1-1]|uniref:4,5-DOPA dioxygenase extradiol n=1 Tax=Sulfurovum zhangzhouensis TaxID=3019067 RepID=A0ABT7QVN1_9BACT|nr:4,5-DOPA dioxygenase extradiol [Sulfurovum zhangzhouensis]MDM5270847.1 4,5-DOPA dioxygenase extradiol [Sulfurovum zhangzhouensis]